jgi:hypothetical protein
VHRYIFSPKPFRHSTTVRDFLRFAGTASAVFVTTGHVVAEDRSGFGVYRSFVDESPKVDCAPYNAVSSPTGWTCNPDPDTRGIVVSKLVGDQCIPTRVSMSYFYTTMTGVRKSIPSALSYQCKDGDMDGTYEERRITLGGPSNTREDSSVSRGKYVKGKKVGVWTYQYVTEGGLAGLGSQTFENDHVVGVSRTTEGGKVVEIECNSQGSTRSAQFWEVKLHKATPEKIALAERAAVACADWNTATCEDFKQQGLFGKEVKCDCDAQCSRAGTCTLEHGQCVEPQSDGDCAKSAACLTNGKCGFYAKTCVVIGDEDCARSTGCAERGLCAEKDGRCVAATDKGCAASLMCKQEKRCHASYSECVAGDARSSQTCTGGPCADGDGTSGQSISGKNDGPVVLGERRSPGLYGLGVAVTIVGGAAVLGGAGGFFYYGELTGKDPTTIQKVAFGATAAVGLGAIFLVGLPMIRTYGERVPVKPPKAATLTIQPVIGPTWIGLHGQF